MLPIAYPTVCHGDCHQGLLLFAHITFDVFPNEKNFATTKWPDVVNTF